MRACVFFMSDTSMISQYLHVFDFIPNLIKLECSPRRDSVSQNYDIFRDTCKAPHHATCMQNLQSTY